MTRYLNKPFSPHLSVYKIQITSLFSIFHRFSAIFLIICFLSFILLILVLNNLFLFNYIIAHNVIYCLFNCLLKIICYFSIFHVVNGFGIILKSFKILSYSNLIYFK